MKHADWCQTCAPDPSKCRHERRQYPNAGCNGHRNKVKCLDQLHRGKPDALGIVCLDCGITLVECPVCAPVTYAHCAGCAGLGWITPQDRTLVRFTLRR
jgi:hypothetical protein